jgi:hypothetical protein
MVRFGFRVPSIRKRVSARNSVGLKVPRDWAGSRTTVGPLITASTIALTQGCLGVLVVVQA